MGSCLLWSFFAIVGRAIPTVFRSFDSTGDKFVYIGALAAWSRFGGKGFGSNQVGVGTVERPLFGTMRKQLAKPGTRFGMLYGLVFASVYVFAPQPVGLSVLFAFVAVQLLVAAVLTWVRTRLALATAAMTIGATWAATFSLLWWTGHHPFSWPFVFLYSTAILPALMLGTESKIHPIEWAIWKKHSESTPLWQTLLGRHIPDMRNL